MGSSPRGISGQPPTWAGRCAPVDEGATGATGTRYFVCTMYIKAAARCVGWSLAPDVQKQEWGACTPERLGIFQTDSKQATVLSDPRGTMKDFDWPILIFPQQPPRMFAHSMNHGPMHSPNA